VCVFVFPSVCLFVCLSLYLLLCVGVCTRTHMMSPVHVCHVCKTMHTGPFGRTTAINRYCHCDSVQGSDPSAIACGRSVNWLYDGQRKLPHVALVQCLVLHGQERWPEQERWPVGHGAFQLGLVDNNYSAELFW